MFGLQFDPTGRRVRSPLPIRTFIPGYEKYRLVGINCGHFKTPSDISDGVHSGLSYYVKSSRVVETLKACAGVKFLSEGKTLADVDKPLIGYVED